jgi:hypothetical protein
VLTLEELNRTTLHRQLLLERSSATSPRTFAEISKVLQERMPGVDIWEGS